MISVLNHQLRLSGNRLGIILCLFALFMAACSGSKEAVRSTKSKGDEISRVNKRTRNNTVDTVRWSEVPEEMMPPIVSEDGPILEKKSSYNITIALPFEAAGFSAEDDNDRFIQFYAGFQMAMDNLKDEGASINVSSFDTEGREKILDQILDNLKTDLIIGPYERVCLKKTADWARENKTPMVSPWVASNRITNKNPYYIQLRPGVREHYNAIVEDVLQKYSPDQVVVLKRFDGADDSKVKYIQDYAAASLGKEDGLPFREFGIEEDSLILGETYMFDLFSKDKTTVFISQNYLFEEDEYVYNTIRKLSAAKGEREAVVYGMPLLIDLDKIDFSLYKLLNVHVARFRYIDTYAENIQQFKREFFQRFRSLPGDDAYFGYDVGYFFGKALMKYGKQFQFFVDQDEDLPLLGSRYDIQKKYPGETVSDDFSDIDYLSNQLVEIIQFADNRFIRVNRKN